MLSASVNSRGRTLTIDNKLTQAFEKQDIFPDVKVCNKNNRLQRGGWQTGIAQRQSID
jgi:hypothetical protein